VLTHRAVHYYSHGANGTFKILSPMVLGHESCGIVTALGPNLPKTVNLKVGQLFHLLPSPDPSQQHPLSSHHGSLSLAVLRLFAPRAVEKLR
jgi:hypothetical protein